MKGLAAAAVESLAAAEAAGHADWLEERARGGDRRAAARRACVEGSRAHAARRVEEMEAAVELLLELGIEPRIAAASAALLAGLAATPQGSSR